MKKSKLFSLISSLDKNERKNFRKFVYTDLFNKNKKVRQLCEILLDSLEQATPSEISKPEVFEEIFGKIPYDELRFNNIISELFKLLHLFLGHSLFMDDSVLKQNLIARALVKREHFAHFNGVMRRYEKLINQGEFRNYDRFLMEYNYHEIMDQYSLSGDKRNYSQGLQTKNDALDQYYLANKLRIACDMYSRNAVINAGYQPHYIEELLNRYQNTPDVFEEIPAIKMYVIAFKMLTEGKEEQYFSLRDYLEVNNHLFPDEELNTIYSYALNYCVRKINSGRSKFYEEIFGLYKALLGRKLLFSSGYLSQWDYTNIITSALRLQEFDWTGRFIDEYRQYLLPEEEFNVYTYNLAALFFAKKDYGKTLELLHDVEFTDPFYHAAAKIIQLKVFFEIGETEALFSLTEAFKKFLKRNKQFSVYQKESNLNFIKAALWLYKAKLNLDLKSPQRYDALMATTLKRVLALKPLANKVWLLEVMEQNGN